MSTKLMTLLCYAMLCITYVTRLDRRRSNTDYALSTSPLLPSSTKIDDAYACHAAAEVTGHVVRHYAAFLWCRIYRAYDFRVGNNVLVTSELVFTSRELVKKKAARVGEWLATFTLFPLSPVQKAGNNATDRVSCTHYFMSIEIIRCSVRRIKTTKPDKKQSVAKSHCIFSI